MQKVAITVEDIIYLENLAKIEVAESDLQKYQKEISDILEYVKEIQTLSLGEDDNFKEIHINNLREDMQIQDTTHIRRALQNAPDKIGNLYKVSQVIRE